MCLPPVLVLPHERNSSGLLLVRKGLLQVLLSWLLPEIYICPRSARGWCPDYFTLDSFWPQTSPCDARYVYSSVLRLRWKKDKSTSNVSNTECAGECNISSPLFLPFIRLRNYRKSLMINKLFVVRGMGSTMPTLALPATLSPPRTWALIILDISQKQRSKVMFTSSSKVAHLLPQWLWNIQPFRTPLWRGFCLWSW